jgi:hypothetical protein
LRQQFSIILARLRKCSLTRYIEALLVDQDLADLVWELWDREMLSEDVASMLWLLISRNGKSGK